MKLREKGVQDEVETVINLLGSQKSRHKIVCTLSRLVNNFTPRTKSSRPTPDSETKVIRGSATVTTTRRLE